MADDTTLGAAVGVGDKISTDDLGAGTKVQRVKVQFGADGSATDASSANPLPVVQTGALPAGANAIGKLAANSGVDIGDVDVTSSALPTGASTSAKQPALGTAGAASADVLTVQGVASMTPILVNGSGVTQPVSGTVTATGPLTDTQLRATPVPVSGTVTATTGGLTDTQLRATAVPVADGGGSLTVDGTVTTNAGTGPWPVTDNGGSLTVDGTVAVSGTVAVTDNSGTLTVDAPVATPVFVRLSDGSAAITTLAVSLATLPALVAGTAAIGKLAANAGVNIGDVTPVPGTAGGWSKIKYAAQTTTVVKPKGTAGTFGGYYAYNPNASVAYIQVFDLATATTVTLGTTVPDMIFGIPAGAAANLEISLGISMTLGMQLACTTTATGLTAPGTGLDLTILFK